jgi:hypothetical protein
MPTLGSTRALRILAVTNCAMCDAMLVHTSAHRSEIYGSFPNFLVLPLKRTHLHRERILRPGPS